MKRQLGFTLIEVMIVVVIVAILAAIAIPSYENSVRKTRRADAKEALTSAAALQERYFFTHNAYASNASTLGISDTSKEGYYQINIVNAVTCTSEGSTYPCFKMYASPKANGPQEKDTICYHFYILHTGKKVSVKKGGNFDNTADHTTADCW